MSYEFTTPLSDARKESQKVVPESIAVGQILKPAERPRFAFDLTRESVEEAAARQETLTLIRPAEVTFSWHPKSDQALNDERRKHADLVKQISMFGQPAKPYEPCPFEFRFRWKTAVGKIHTHTCDDWETSTAFFRRRERHGEVEGLKSLRTTYEEDYMARGMRLALGTHSRRSSQWLLVGVIRVDEHTQQTLQF